MSGPPQMDPPPLVDVLKAFSASLNLLYCSVIS
jgi:hypothetical protein